jgi:hypothetical protein
LRPLSGEGCRRACDSPLTTQCYPSEVSEEGRGALYVPRAHSLDRGRRRKGFDRWGTVRDRRRGAAAGSDRGCQRALPVSTPVDAAGCWWGNVGMRRVFALPRGGSAAPAPMTLGRRMGYGDTVPLRLGSWPAFLLSDSPLVWRSAHQHCSGFPRPPEFAIPGLGGAGKSLRGTSAAASETSPPCPSPLVRHCRHDFPL